MPYSRKIWRGIKFGALADRPTYCQIKNPPILISIRTYVRIRILWPAGPPTREAQPHNNGCGQSRTSVRARASLFSAVFSFWRVCFEWRRWKILFLYTYHVAVSLLRQSWHAIESAIAEWQGNRKCQRQCEEVTRKSQERTLCASAMRLRCTCTCGLYWMCAWVCLASQSSAKFKSANIFVHPGWGQSAKI